MNNDILPAIKRLYTAMENAGQVSRKIINVFQEAEEVAGSDLASAMMEIAEVALAIDVITSAVAFFPTIVVIGLGNRLINALQENDSRLPQTLTDLAGREHPRPDWFTTTDNRDGGINGSPNAETLFINGIQTDHDSHMDALLKLSSQRGGAPITGIYNKTDGVVGDLNQSVNDIADAWFGKRIDGGNPAVDSAVQRIKDHPNGEIVAHSQGAAIISVALSTARQQDIDLSGLSVITIGGAGSRFPEGPNYHHIVRSFDPVPTLLNPGTLIGYAKNQHVSVIRGSINPVEAHSLDGYLRDINRAHELETIWVDTQKDYWDSVYDKFISDWL